MTFHGAIFGAKTSAKTLVSWPGRPLVIFDSADTIDNADDASYINLNYLLPDAPCVDVINTTRSSRAQEMTALEVLSEVGQTGVN